MAKRTRRVKHGGMPFAVKIAILAIVAAAVVLLSMYALGQQKQEVEGAGTVPTLPDTTPRKTPEPASEAQAPAYAVPSVQRILAVGAEDGHVLRATIGACPEPAGSVEVSRDYGTNWSAANLAAVDARSILQLDASDAAIVRMTSLNGSCEPSVSRSFVGGTSWEPDQNVSGWFIDPSNPAVVRTPTGAFELPCKAAGLSAQSMRGVVLCGDSTVLVSEDEGVTWSPPLSVPNGAAVGITAEGYAVVSTGEAECAGIRTRLISGGALSEPGACLEIADAGAGQTAIAGGSSGWYLWVGESFFRSSDTGAVWR